MFNATCELLRLLDRAMKRGIDPVNLNVQLQRRLVNVAMNCPGFTVAMKDDIAFLMDMSDHRKSWYHLPREAHTWRHQYAIAPKANVPLDVVEVSDSLRASSDE